MKRRFYLITILMFFAQIGFDSYLLFAKTSISRNKAHNIQEEVSTGKIRQKKFFIILETNYLNFSDNDFADVYSSGRILPIYRLGYMFDRSFYIWTAYSKLYAKGNIPDFSIESKSNQSFFFLGIGLKKKLSQKLSYKIEISSMSVKIKEESLGLIYSGSSRGFSFEGGIVFDINTSIFIELSGGYLSASTIAFDHSISIGGLRSGIGVGFRF